MKVYTYFSRVGCLEDADLLECWTSSWRRFGWEPVVLSSQHAHATNPGIFKQLTDSVLLTGPHDREYVLSTLLRWLAMVPIAGRSLHVDWDVMCNGLKPSDIQFDEARLTFLSANHCPCAVAADSHGWNFMVQCLLAAPYHPKFKTEDLVLDCSDQYAFGLFKSVIPTSDPVLVKAWTEDDAWATAPAIHFPNRLTSYPRSRIIRQVLP